MRLLHTLSKVALNTQGGTMSKLETIAETTSDLQQLADLAQHQTVPVRYAVLNNPKVTHDILVTLSNDGNRDISDTAKRLLEGFSSSTPKRNPEYTEEILFEESTDLAGEYLAKLHARSALFMGLTLILSIIGILILFISVGMWLSSYGGNISSPATAFVFLGIALLQLAFVFAVGYIFTSTMAQHASVSYYLAN